MFWMVLTGLMMQGCSYMRHVKRLEEPEKEHWYALKVFMKEDQRKEYLTKKTRAERDEYLKGLELWDKFYELSERRRKAILDYDVAVGWNQEELLMSWGKPHKTGMEPTNKAPRASRWTYTFEVHLDKKTKKEYRIIWEPNSKTEYKSIRTYDCDVIIQDYGRPEWTDNVISDIIIKD